MKRTFLAIGAFTVTLLWAGYSLAQGADPAPGLPAEVLSAAGQTATPVALATLVWLVYYTAKTLLPRVQEGFDKALSEQRADFLRALDLQREQLGALTETIGELSVVVLTHDLAVRGRQAVRPLGVSEGTRNKAEATLSARGTVVL